MSIQSFRNGEADTEPSLIDNSELVRFGSESDAKPVLHASLFDPERFPNAIDAGWNLASHLCAAADSKFASDDLRPLFVERKSSNI